MRKWLVLAAFLSISAFGAGEVRFPNGVISNLTGNVTGNCSTATALFADPADCGANTSATGINASGTLSCSSVPTILGYTPVPTTRTINGYDLSANRTLSASDVSADASGTAASAVSAHLGAFVHSDIAHSNRTALDAVTGTNTGDETQATIKSKLGAAATGADGYLTSTDWNTFNGKQAALGFTPVPNTRTVNSKALSSDISITASDVGLGNVTNDAQIAKSIGTTKGDLITFTASATPTRRPVSGNDGYVLTESAASADGVVWAAVPSAPTGPRDIHNLGLSAALSSNTLVVSLKQADGSSDPAAGSGAVKVGFRGATATNGNYDILSVTASTSITLGTGDSIGSTTAVPNLLNVWLVKDTANEICLENTAQITLVKAATHAVVSDGYLGSASALTGGNDISGDVVWCTGAHSSKPMRRIGQIIATWTTGTGWTAISHVTAQPSIVRRGAIYTDSTGTTAFTAPLSARRMTVCGHGGGGGGGGGAAASYAGNGGGGAASTCKDVDVTPGTAYTVTVGAGGTAGSYPSGAGGTGGDSSFGSLAVFKGAIGGRGGDAYQSSVTILRQFGQPVGGGGIGGAISDGTGTTTSGGPSQFAAGGSPGGTTAVHGSGGGAGDGAGGNGGVNGGSSPTAGTDGGGGGGSQIGGAGAAGGVGKITLTWIQ